MSERSDSSDESLDEVSVDEEQIICAITTFVGLDLDYMLGSTRKRKRPGIAHTRRARTKKDYEETRWWQLIHNPLTGDRSSFLGKLFRNRFRVPLSLFWKIHDLFVERNWLQKPEWDAFHRPTIPFKLKLLAALRFIGRGECFDTIQELTADRVSANVIREFVIMWAAKMASLRSEYIKPPNPDNKAEIEALMEMYSKLGFPGCVGSTDCVNIALERCPYTEKQRHTGKDGYPTLGFNCTVNHHRRFLHIAPSCPGAMNDKAKVWFDLFVDRVRNNQKFKDLEFTVRTAAGDKEVVKGAYLIVDGGYHRWRVLQCPLKHSSDKKECLQSKWLESVRKDVECAFGILKTRFRFLKLPSRFQNLQVVDNLFVACAIIHNMLLDDELEQREEQLSGLFAEKEDLLNWIRDSKRYRAESVKFQLRRVALRSSAATDMSSTGDNGVSEEIDEEDEIDETESEWAVLHDKLVEHFYRQWCTVQLDWTGCRQPVRMHRVRELMANRNITE